MLKYLVLLVILLNLSCQPSTKKNEQQSEKVDLLQPLLERSKKEHKKIFLVFGFKACGWCKAFNRYHYDPAVKEILDKYFIIAAVDIDRSQEELDLYKNYVAIGFPSWDIIDLNRNLIVNSDSRKDGYSVGYPHSENDIQYYIKAIKKSAPEITESECENLRQKLMFYRIH